MGAAAAVDYLDAAAHDLAPLKGRLWDLLLARPGDRILDAGCGLGDDVRALGDVVGPEGEVVGLDASAVMIAEAKRRTSHGHVRFVRGRRRIDALHDERVRRGPRRARAPACKFEWALNFLEELSRDGRKCVVWTSFVRNIDQFSGLVRHRLGVPVYAVDGRIPAADVSDDVESGDELAHVARRARRAGARCRRGGSASARA